MLEHVIEKTVAYLAYMPKRLRKKVGQFFTSAETARFMAGLFRIPAKAHLDMEIVSWDCG